MVQGIGGGGTLSAVTSEYTMVEPNNEADLRAKINNWTVGGKPVWIPDGTYTLTANLHPPDFLKWRGTGERTILRPADASITPLIDIDEHEGTAGRQEKIEATDFKIDMRNYADTECMHIHNLKDSHFERLYLGNFKKTGFYLDGDATGYTFWNTFRDIQFEAAGADTADPLAACALIHAEKNFHDSWFDNIYGYTPHCIGLRVFGGGAFQINKAWFVGCMHMAYIHPNQNGGGWTAQNIKLQDWVSDTTRHHDFVLDRTHGTLTDIIIKDPLFMVAHEHADQAGLYMVAGDAQTIHRCVMSGGRNSSTWNNHKYVIQFAGTGTGATLNCQWRNNIMTTGLTASTVGLVGGDLLDNVWY